MDKFNLVSFGILILLALAIVVILTNDMTFANIFFALFG